ncbi:MAG TPA: hypothetical protein VGS19_35705 [Streptosporangiaceae bacterium]|nr:hypothetical protein [Streptosporangiaceae bacterium]
MNFPTGRARRAGKRFALVAVLAGLGSAGIGATGSWAPDAQAATVLPATGRAGAAAWSVQPTPRIPAPAGGLSRVSCSSATFCVAVGDPPLTRPLAASWNGTAWRRMPIPAATQELAGVSCTSPSFCVAAGLGHPVNATPTPLILAWNGSRWAVQPSLSIPSTQLTAVSCASPTACLAVGDTTNVIVSVDHPLAEVWNGQRWSRVTVPGGSQLNGSFGDVSCSAATACTAAGGYHKGGRFNPLIERWNGTGLSAQTASQPGTVAGISCPQDNGCVAVGHVGSSAVAQVWDGTTWTAMTLPKLVGGLDGVSCTAVTACTAVGSTVASNGNALLLAEALTGTTWKVQFTPQPSRSISSSFSGVSCVSAPECMAVGGYENQGQQVLSLDEEWDGTRWTAQSVPNLQGPPQGSFSGVSCAGPSVCTALGSYQTSGSVNVPLTEAWDGTRWAIHRSPPPAAFPINPAGISCPATTSCVAVGAQQTLQERTLPWAAVWDGSHWPAAQLPPPPGNPVVAELTSVSCGSATLCVAVGLDQGNGQDGLAYAWDGTKWTLIPPPSSTTNLEGVSCSAAASCVAVGGISSSWAALSWDGHAWKAQPTSGSPSIVAVSCTGPAACTAVGTQGGSQPLAVERWDGSTWTAQQAAPPPPAQAGFQDVSCATATACTAVGFSASASNKLSPIIQSWDGSTWVSEQAPATGSSVLYAVSCTAPDVCTAVGEQKYGTPKLAPLAEHSG